MRSRRTVQLFSCTDAGNAELFVSRYGGRVRYDHQHGRWLIWDTCIKRWTADTEGKIRILAIETARYRLGIAARISDDTKRNLQANWALQSEDRHRLHAALDIARSLPPISDAGSAWDADPWLFGVANGVLDLRKGELREERPEDQITKRSTVQYDPAARCPQFERFLGEIFNADQALVSYTQRAIGYCLTGVINEQCFFSCYGFGANGKSTLFALLHTIFGDYAVNLPFSALEMKERNSHDLVALAGCRFATASETDEGVRLNEARIKALTGGDPITARRLYHEPFTFDPSHKLWLAFNYRPVILDNSEGMWRRVHLIPFTRQFKQTEQDKNLVNKLRDEAPGILAWAVRGCLLWHKEGLGMPSSVADATLAYRAESDHVGRFLDECCIADQSAFVTSAALWERYLQWVIETDESPLSRPVFAERLKRRNFNIGRHGHTGTRVWVGVALIPSGGGIYADTLTTAGDISQKLPI